MPGEEELIAQRREKLERIRARGVDPYPPRVSRTHSTAEAAQAFDAWEQAGSTGDAPDVSVAGRITARRDMGKASFVDVRDGSGRLQAFLKKDVLGDAYAILDDLDLGDFIAVTGPLIRTRTGEVTVEAREITVVAKALRPPPEKWHGLEDVEIRYRQRYLDLMSNEDVRAIFRTRANVIAAIRRFLDERGFIEVEGPVLQGD